MNAKLEKSLDKKMMRYSRLSILSSKIRRQSTFLQPRVLPFTTSEFRVKFVSFNLRNCFIYPKWEDNPFWDDNSLYNDTQFLSNILAVFPIFAAFSWKTSC